MPIVAQVTVLQSLNDISNFIMSYAITLAALGALTVAIIEAWKKLRDSPAIFHRRSVLRWLDNDPGREGVMTSSHYRVWPADPDQQAVSPDSRKSYTSARCFEQLLWLTTGVQPVEEGKAPRFHAALARGWTSYGRSIGSALFELELDRMMGQVQDAADVALNNPRMFPDLFAFLTRGASLEDAQRWQDDVTVAMTTLASDNPRRKDIADRYIRLKQLVRRHLDSFQIVTAARWREWNQLAAVVVGAVLLFVAQYMNVQQNGVASAVDWLKIMPVSLLGGMLAPVAKDLVDALRKVKSNV